MATRRIARGRGGSPIPIIILAVLLVGGVGLSIVLGMKTGDLNDEIGRLKAQVLTEQKSTRGAENRVRQLEVLTGLSMGAMKESFDRIKKAALEEADISQGDAGQTKLDNLHDLIIAYATEVKTLRNEVTRIEGELKEAVRLRAEAGEAQRTAKKENDEKVALVEAASAKVRDAKARIQDEADKAAATLKRQVGLLDGEKTKLIKEVNHWKKTSEVLARTVDQLKKDIVELKDPRTRVGSLVPDEIVAGEPIDGKILTVEPDGTHVTIDLGRRDWVQLGMEFKVYDNSNPDERKVKGHIQVRRVFDTIAQCKVLQQDELDPLLPQMAIVNPAFEKGKNLNFVLLGEFKEPNMEQFLARYPCRVTRMKVDDEGKKLSRETDYVITGEKAPREGELRPEDSDIVAQAKKWKITIMQESTLLRYLGELD